MLKDATDKEGRDMSLIRWRRPIVPNLFDDMERMALSLAPRRWWPEAAEYDLTPAVDVYETDDEVVVKAELPGAKKEDIEVTATEDQVVICGESKSEEEVKEEGYHRRELRCGSFRRTVGLPSAVDQEKVQATFQDGVLEVRAPKVAEVGPGKKIEIT
jgi:HSP20 family protein